MTNSKTMPPGITSTAEFARYVGLARTTVSRVLNRQPGLKQSTIDRVQHALAETGFTPNAYATLLKGKGTSSIGICLENLLTPPILLKLAALQRQLRGQGYTSLIEVYERGQSRTILRHFLSMRVQAVVFIGHFDTAELETRIRELSGHKTPHLVIDHHGIPHANTVTLDRAQAMREMMHHLLDLGHRSFGLLGIPLEHPSRLERIHGIRRALSERGLDLQACARSFDAQCPRTQDFEFGHALTRQFLELKQPPTAYVALNDEIAIGAIRALHEAGLTVPGDASVTGFNNQDLCTMMAPPLTTVDQQIEPTIKAAMQVLMAHVRGGMPARTILRTIKPELIIRQSTGRAVR
ncbi:MAG TPA: LacI family DNA-binding transcriptional regulator [Opitutaceae bacterium]|nr:LacI family DNA-binding transcriptional regulator [Opitutaceae bacterium]